MKNYRHLSQEERYQIQALDRQAIPVAAIARQLSRHVDTIKRELRVGCVGQHYCAQHAQQLSTQRKAASRNARRITHDIWVLVGAYLALQLSPQQVSARLFAQANVRVSTESIYLYVYGHPELGAVTLRCNHKKRRRRRGSGSAKRAQRGAINNRVGIELRPAIVDSKSRIGDWEGDTVVGKRHLGGLLTLVDRCSRYTLARPLARRCATPASLAIIELLGPHTQRCHTITLDNGSEFALHEQFAVSLQAQVFFAKPHSPWQRGLNENTNGLLRQYFPKGSCLRNVTPEQVQYAVDRLNHRPRKCLGWRTPHEVFFNLPMTKLTL
jgi:transposase, IS30 family